MGFRPVEQGQFKLSHALEHIAIVFAFAHFLGHVFADGGNALVTGVLFVADQQVQFAVLFDFDAQLIQSLDGSIAGEEVLGTGSEGDDLQILQSDDHAGDRDELGDLVGQFSGGAHGVFRDIALQVAHTQVVGAVQHTAVCVAAAIDHVSVAFSSSHEHHGTVEVTGDQGFRGFRAEVAQEHAGSVAAGGVELFHSLEHVFFILNGGFDFNEIQFLLAALFSDGGTALFAQRDGETVAADGDESQLDDGDVFHHGYRPPP